MSTKEITIAIQDLHFTALEQGPEKGELVLLLHGFPQFADAWREVMGPIAQAGFRVVAVDQRGYSKGARPAMVGDYALDHLIHDVNGFADALGANRFHMVGHDWGGLVAWHFASRYPERLLSLTVLSTPHPDAWRSAIQTDEDQRRKSQYIALFRKAGYAAEQILAAANYQRLRGVYQDKIAGPAIEKNILRFVEEGALTAALNWYRALDMEHPAQAGEIKVPTLYVWGSEDLALGKTAALQTERYMAALTDSNASKEGPIG